MLSIIKKQKSNGITGKYINKKTIPYLLLAPAFLYYIIFWATPIFMGVREVFTDMDGNFTLLGNIRLMAQSDYFYDALKNTALFAFISVLLEYFLALGLAILLNRKIKGIKMLMFIAMIPMALTPTAVAIMWKSGLMNNGWINSILVQLGFLTEPIPFLSSEGLRAIIMIVLIDAWNVMPQVMIILIAGLQNMDKELKEVATTFGANKYQVLKDITIPILKPTIITSVILRLIAAIQVWAISVLTIGFTKLPFLVERVAYYVDAVYGLTYAEKLAYSYSCLTAVLVFITTLIYFKVAKRGTAFDGGTQR